MKILLEYQTKNYRLRAVRKLSEAGLAPKRWGRRLAGKKSKCEEAYHHLLDLRRKSLMDICGTEFYTFQQKKHRTNTVLFS